MTNKSLAPAELGHSFERRVRDAFEKNSFLFLQKNQWKKNYAPELDSASKREYDLVMFNLADKRFYIIECKAHYSADAFVGLSEVKEFVNKLSNYNGRPVGKAIVSDTDFTSSALGYAQNHDIHAVNGRQLKMMEKNKAGLVRGIVAKAVFSCLEGLVDRLIKSY
ncbi:MAG: restriction endonuclease [archaeon]